MKKYMFMIMMILMTGAFAETIYIPDDYSTIQEGIDESEDGDEIIVSPGTYVENINFNGKAIILGSLFYTTQDPSYISQTIIDGNQDGSVVTFESEEGSTSVLTGFTITNGQGFSGSYPDNTGGGITCINYSSPSLVNMTIMGNSAEYRGGGICCRSESSPSIENVTVTDNSSYAGGGIYCNNSSPSLVNVTITSNSADEWGGGISCEFSSSPSLVNVTITDNSAGFSSGGMDCYDSSPSLENVTITGNSSDRGGGICCWTNSSPSLVNVTIMGNSALDGGGICCRNDSSPSLENVLITDNSANTGGGICCRSNSSPSLVNVTITDNLAGTGGGIFCWESSPSLVNVQISYNLANHAGGIYCGWDSNLSIEKVTIKGNSADIGGGIACAYSSSPSLLNVTITDNSADEWGGGICCTLNSSPILANCILWNNSPQEVEFCDDYDPNTITIAYSDIEGGEEGIVTNNNGTINWLAGNIDADPLFVNALVGNYHLTEDSPCIDTGTSYFEYDGEIFVDLSEDEYYGAAPDMGALEYNGLQYGDIDDNGLVESYDAALVLMYVVGLDPLPELDPLPWSDWRVARADVNLSGDIGAIDAAYILQYVVGIISELPVVDAMRLAPGEITISHDAQYIYLYSQNSIFSLEYDAYEENLTIDLPEVINEDCLYSYNDNKFALISAAGIAGDVVKIPYQVKSQGAWNIQFQIEDNGNSYDLEYLSEDIIQNSKLNIQNYPNPFNPETNIVFELSASGNVLIEIYNIKGQKITNLVNEPFEAGRHKVTWNAVGQSSGIYLLRFNTAENSETKKLILLK